MASNGALGRALGRGHTDLHSDAVSGPASYSTGGFTVSTPAVDTSEVAEFVVSVRGQSSGPANTVLSAEPTVASDGSLTVTMQALDTSASPPTWSEVSSGTDLSGVTLDVIVVYES